MTEIIYCRICTHTTTDTRYSKRHSKSVHPVASAANLPLGYRGYSKAPPGLPFCQICGIFIGDGDDMLEAHKNNRLHCGLLNASQAIHTTPGETHIDVDMIPQTRQVKEIAASVPIEQNTPSDPDVYNPDYGDLSDRTQGKSRRWDDNEIPSHKMEDWLLRDLDLPFDSDPWVGEIVLSPTPFFFKSRTEQEVVSEELLRRRSTNWKLYSRIRITRIVHMNGVKVSLSSEVTSPFVTTFNIFPFSPITSTYIIGSDCLLLRHKP